MIRVNLYFTDGSRESAGEFQALPRIGERLTLSRPVRSMWVENGVASYTYEVVGIEWSGTEYGAYVPHLTLREEL